MLNRPYWRTAPTSNSYWPAIIDKRSMIVLQVLTSNFDFVCFDLYYGFSNIPFPPTSSPTPPHSLSLIVEFSFRFLLDLCCELFGFSNHFSCTTTRKSTVCCCFVFIVVFVTGILSYNSQFCHIFY